MFVETIQDLLSTLEVVLTSGLFHSNPNILISLRGFTAFPTRLMIININ